MPMKESALQLEPSSGQMRSRAPGPQSQGPGAFRPSFAGSILSLQRSIGNQSFGRMLQASGIQAKLRISQPGDPYEQEADRVADQVMRMPAPSASALSLGDPIASSTSSTCERESGVPPRFLHGLGAGRRLDRSVREFVEPRFGYDFSQVRIHTDTPSVDSARQVNALAFTVGRDIAFAQGQFNPHTRAGLHLLSHELAHVAQQGASGSIRQAPPSVAGNGLTLDERADASVLAAHRVPGRMTLGLSKVPSGQIQRKLIATGDSAGFAALANSIIAVQQKVVVSAAGLLSVQSTNVQGPPTPEAQVLVDTLQRVINDSGTTSIEFIHGATSTRESDRRVFGGSFPQSKVDIDDEAVLGTQESLGLGQGATAGAVLAHEIEEQFRKQQLAQGFDEAHAGALAVEEKAVGAARAVSERAISGGKEVTYTYTYPSGRVVELKFDIINGNRTNIRRVVRP